MQPCFFIHLKRRFIRIDIADVRYILSVGHYVKIVTDHGHFLPHLDLNEMEAVLPADQFAYVNRQTIVAVNRVTQFDTEEIVLGLDERFALSEKCRKEFKARVTILTHQKKESTVSFSLAQESIAAN